MFYALGIHGTLYPLGLNPGVALLLIKFCLTHWAIAAPPAIAFTLGATPATALEIPSPPAIALATVATPELLIEWAATPQVTVRVDQCNHPLS